MKFELKEEDVSFEGETVKLPKAVFAKLIKYIKEAESKLLAREINLREVERVAKELGVGEIIRKGLRGEPLIGVAEVIKKALNERPIKK